MAEGDAASFVNHAREFGRGLASLGRATDAPVVPPRFGELASLAERGGVSAVWRGRRRCRRVAVLRLLRSGLALARDALSMRPLAIAVDHGGVRPSPLALRNILHRQDIASSRIL